MAIFNSHVKLPEGKYIENALPIFFAAGDPGFRAVIHEAPSWDNLHLPLGGRGRPGVRGGFHPKNGRTTGRPKKMDVDQIVGWKTLWNFTDINGMKPAKMNAKMNVDFTD